MTCGTPMGWARRAAWILALPCALLACKGDRVGPPLNASGGSAGAGAAPATGGAGDHPGDGGTSTSASGAAAGSAGIGGGGSSAGGGDAGGGSAGSGSAASGGSSGSGSGAGGGSSGSGGANGGSSGSGGANGGSSGSGGASGGSSGGVTSSGGASPGGASGSGGGDTGGAAGAGLAPATGGYGGSVVPCSTPPCGAQELVDAADDGGVIELGPSTVFENVSVTGKRVVFDCNRDGTLTPWSCFDDNQPALVAGPGADVTVVGCVFEGCQGDLSDASAGGAILIQGARRLVVRGCVFRNNAAYRGPALTTWRAGGQDQVDAAATVIFESNLVHDNHAASAGAIYLDGEMTVHIVNNVFAYNRADEHAPALWLLAQRQDRMRFDKNVVYTNIGTSGAALETDTDECPLVNSSIVLGNVYGAQLGARCPSPVHSQVTGAPPFVDALGYDFGIVPGTAAEDGGDPAFPLDSDGSRNDQGPYLDRLPRELDGGEVLAGG